MKHPSSLDLEAFACGEPIEKVASHLNECAACAAFVERLRGAISAGPSREKAEEVVARVASRSATDDAPTKAARESTRPEARASDLARRRWFLRASTVALPLAAAAALLLFLRDPSTKGVAVSAPASTEQPTAPTDPTSETTFKGGAQVAVIRERAGQQTRFTGVVRVRPNDRLRVEVALDREQAILAAVLGDDASWLELMPEGVRRPGTHFSERSARIDTSPLHGTILVGAPAAVAHARATKHFEGISAIRVEWETP